MKTKDDVGSPSLSGETDYLPNLSPQGGYIPHLPSPARESLRKDFPIFQSGVAYLDSANTSQRPIQVLEAMLDYYRNYNANIHRAAYSFSEQATEQYESTRTRLQKYLNAPSKREIIYTRGTTESINLVANSWGRQNIQAGDLIVLTILEHHSNIVPWQLLAKERGARIAYVDIDEQGELKMEHFYQLLEERPKLVAFTQVSNTIGTITPWASMCEAAHGAGAVVLIDGAQGAPHMGFDIQAAGCDFYALSSHKMCGPTGVGALWGRRELLEAMPPFMGGGDMIRSVTVEGTTFAELPGKFEAGTQPIAEVIGWGAALDYLQKVGLPAIARHETELTKYAIERLSALPEIRIFGPPASRRAGIISFEVQGIHPHDVATILDRKQVAVRSGHNCTQPLLQRLGVDSTVRASFYLYTQFEEIDRMIEGLIEAQEIFKGKAL